MSVCGDISRFLAYSDQTFVDGGEVPSLLHGDEPEMVLLIHPAEEGLVIVEEDSSADRPIVVSAGVLQEPEPNKENKYTCTKKLEGTPPSGRCICFLYKFKHATGVIITILQKNYLNCGAVLCVS